MFQSLGARSSDSKESIFAGNFLSTFGLSLLKDLSQSFLELISWWLPVLPDLEAHTTGVNRFFQLSDVDGLLSHVSLTAVVQAVHVPDEEIVQ